MWVPGDGGYERIHGTGSTIAARSSTSSGDAVDELRVFYTCYESGETVESRAPIAAAREDIIAIARRVLRGDGDFLGLVDQQDGTLQLMREADGRVWMEIPVPAEGGSYGKHVELGEVEATLAGIAVPFDPEELPGLRFEPW